MALPFFYAPFIPPVRVRINDSLFQIHVELVAAGALH
jgi:hypothetical protein